ncbi:MAG TPA: riboflavin biosynthesis protein RibF [Verrucomicrobiae bacterium]|nr:riboflavin biosynthesis protein RibF [Verrucomicrobiae bacterium]
MEVRFGLPAAGQVATGPGVVATIGTFDGVHVGHRAVLARLAERAAGARAETLVCTFDPHPRAVLLPGRAPLQLTSLDARRMLLAGLGVDRLHVVEFSLGLSRLSAETFLDRLGSRHRLVGLVLGPGFAMGHRRHGTTAVLAAHGLRRGFWVETLAPVESEDRRVSSSLVRERVASGELAAAGQLLARPFSFSGLVVPGDRVATRLGFPTANLRCRPEQLLPALGIYVAWARREGGRWGPAVASVGIRPHFGGGPVVVEVHCLWPPGTLYGEVLEVAWVERLRSEARFSSERALRDQIARDVDAARARLTGAAGPPGLGG